MVAVLSKPKTARTPEKFSETWVLNCEVCVANQRGGYLLEGTVLPGVAT